MILLDQDLFIISIPMVKINHTCLANTRVILLVFVGLKTFWSAQTFTELEMWDRRLTVVLAEMDVARVNPPD